MFFGDGSGSGVEPGAGDVGIGAAVTGVQQYAGLVRSDSFTVDPAQIPAAIKEVEDLRDEANQAAQAARHMTTPPPLGASEVAMLMSGKLVEVASSNADGSQAWAYEQYANALQDIATALSDAKGKYEAVEQANADAFGKQGS